MSPILYTNIEGHRIQLHCGVIKPSPALLADRRLSLLRQGSSVLLFPHKSSYLPCFQVTSPFWDIFHPTIFVICSQFMFYLTFFPT